MVRERIGGEILKGHIATLVLAVINDRPRHGYDIMKTLSRRSEGVFELGQGTIYPLLYSLEEEGLVRSKDEVVDGRVRRVYSISPKGKRSLSRRKETWQVLRSAIESVLNGVQMEGLAHVRI